MMKKKAKGLTRFKTWIVESTWSGKYYRSTFENPFNSLDDAVMHTILYPKENFRIIERTITERVVK